MLLFTVVAYAGSGRHQTLLLLLSKVVDSIFCFYSLSIGANFTLQVCASDSHNISIQEDRDFIFVSYVFDR